MTAIDNFFSSFEEMVQSAITIPNGHHAVTFKKLIFSSILDALSKTVGSEKFSNYERFSRFVVRFCDWPHHSKVSIPHLVRFLKLVPIPEFEELRKASLREIGNWDEGTIINLDRDFDLTFVQTRWPKDQKLKEPFGKISIESLTHVSLLWKYRNALVHEIRRLGFGMDSLDLQDPSYLSTRHGDKEDYYEVWELIYPVPFFETLSKNGIRNLKAYFRDNGLNPYDLFEFGSYWIEGLNA